MKKIIISLTVAILLCFTCMTAFAEGVLVSDFDAEDISGFMGHNTAQQGYGISDPTVSAAAGDNGMGAKVEVAKNDSVNSTVQDFRIKDASAISAVLANQGSGKYFRLYIDASGCNFKLALRVSFRPDSGRVDFDCSNAVLVSANGTKPTVETKDDSTSSVSNAKVIIPAGFKGYLYLPFDALSASLDGVSSLRYIGFDVRWNDQAGDDLATSETSGYYIFDSAMIVDEIENIEQNDTFDTSVLAYAVATIIGCGALVAIKRK